MMDTQIDTCFTSLAREQHRQMETARTRRSLQ
jgi:hypothetical protein